MTQELEYVILNTDMGWVAILGSVRGLLKVSLPQHSAQEALKLLGEMVNHATWSPGRFDDIAERLKAYLGGHRVAFPDELDLSLATPFQRQVWQTTRPIPYSETRSYLWLAEQTGQPRAVRAVGQALARNPVTIIIPCHRVIGSNGGLGGFSGGLEMKKRLLHLEAANSNI